MAIHDDNKTPEVRDYYKQSVGDRLFAGAMVLLLTTVLAGMYNSVVWQFMMPVLTVFFLCVMVGLIGYFSYIAIRGRLP